MSAPDASAQSSSMNAMELKQIALRSEAQRAQRANSIPRSTAHDTIMTDMDMEISQQERLDLRGYQAPPSTAARLDPAVPVRGMDKLVLDLLASQSRTEHQGVTICSLEAEVSHLRDEVALERRGHQAALDRIQAVERMMERQSSVQLAQKQEEVDELQRLLAFHMANGEEVSRQFRDLQAMCQDLEASLRAKDVALEESASLIKDLDLRPCGPSEGSKETHEA